MAGETRYVGWTSSDSTYVCDGTSDDVQINQALAWAAANPGNTVYLRGPYTYDIRSTLRIGSYTVFTGDSTAIIRLDDSCAWASMVPVIGQYGGSGTVSAGIEIFGFQIDCNEANLYGVGGRKHGKGYYNAIYIQGQSTNRATDIHIHNLTIYNSMGDGTRFAYCTNVRVHDCTMWNLEHCSVFCIDSTKINIFNNDIQAITCSGVRLDNCQEWAVYKNNIRDWTGETHAPKYGEYGVQFGNQPPGLGHTTETKDGNVYENIIDVGGCGIQIEDYLKTAKTSAQTVDIHNNTITGGSDDVDYFAGITIYSWGNGLTISKNTITGSERAGILVRGAIISGVSATITSNNIINTAKAGSVGGYGIWNLIPTKFTLTVKGNYAYGNIAGNYKNVIPVSESSSYIDDAIPEGGIDISDPDEPTNPNDPDTSIYVPATSSIIDDDDDYYFDRIKKESYINGIKFRYIKYSNSGGKSIGQSKSPSVAGSNLSDFDFEGSTTTFECVAKTEAEKNKILAAFYKTGRTKIELGGALDGYRIVGTGASHDSNIDLRTDNPFFDMNGAYFFNLMFLNEYPYMEKIYPRVRGRYIYNSMQFSADDAFAGNLVQNSSFENWTPNSSIKWDLQTSAYDNAWEDIGYSPELDQFCSVASSGTANTLIQISTDAKTWSIPTGLTSAANCNNAWKCVSWCPGWSMWAAFSASGTAGYACVTSSANGNVWAAVATPSAADSMGWSTSIFIPPSSDIVILGNSEGDELYIEEEGVQYLISIEDDRTVLESGRILVLASSGTGNRVMYSDDECVTWNIVASADDAASWIDSAYSPELHVVVAVAYTGEISYSADFGATWSLATDTGQKLTSVTWSSVWGMFVACSEDGTHQIITSENGAEWVFRDTPYTSTEIFNAGTVVKSIRDNTNTGWNYTTPATSYTVSNGYDPLMYTFTLPALTNGHIYRIENVRCQLRAVYAGATASMKVTVQAPSLYSGVETTLKEWTETSTKYQQKSYDISLDSISAEAVTIRFYLKTSKSCIRAGATLMGYTASEMTASGSTITYNSNQWRGIVSANEINLVIAVANTGDGNRIMYATSPDIWTIGTSAADYSWESICYAAERNIFAAVGMSGTGKRVMTMEGYGSLVDVAPDNWTFETTGFTRSEDYAVDGQYSLQIEGNGLEEPGKISQVLGFDSYYDPGEMYILSGKGKVTGLTAGSFKCDVYAGGTVVKELVWDADTDDWEQKQIRFKFDTVPSRVYIRVHGSGTPNTGAIFNFEDVITERLSDYENGQKGLGIITDGCYNAIPDVTIRGVGVSSSSASTSRKLSNETIPEDVFESISTSYGYPIWAVTLPALTDGSVYKIDELAFYIKSSSSSGYTYLNVTIQAASLFNGKETAVAMWTTNQTTEYRHCVYSLPYDLLSATDEPVTLRYYMRISRAPYTAYAWKLSYKCTEILDEKVVSTSDIYLYNTADPRRILHICNSLPKGYMAKICRDYIGSYRYIEHFDTGAYASNAYSISGSVARDEAKNSLVMASGSSIVFPFSTLYPVTGIPFVKMYVYSGIPQISIAEDVNGEPGTFYTVDSNTSTSLNGAEIQRELDNIENLRLKGKTKYYMKITPATGKSCEFSQMLEYASLDTMDAMRIFIYPTAEANTLSVVVGDSGKCSAVMSLSYRDTEILS